MVKIGSLLVMAELNVHGQLFAIFCQPKLGQIRPKIASFGNESAELAKNRQDRAKIARQFLLFLILAIFGQSCRFSAAGQLRFLQLLAGFALAIFAF